MFRAVQRIGKPAVYVLVVLSAAGVARYFLPQPAFITAPNLNLLRQHGFFFLGHIGGGLVAALTGLLQFSGTLRRRRPALHRNLGKAYVLAVFYAGAMAVALGPFMFRAFAMPSIIRGVPPMLAISGFGAREFLPAFLGFELLAPVWVALTAMAYRRARQRRFDEHRAWMLRSYSLTFAFVSVRLVAGPVQLLIGIPWVALAVSIWSWALNLVVAEWIIRSDARKVTRLAAAAG